MDLTKATKAELEEQLKSLNEQYEGYKARNLKLDMSRGKPGADQLDACEGMLTAVKASADTVYEGLDTRNYGVMEGIPAGCLPSCWKCLWSRCWPAATPA